jgi:hypothetical protein
MNNWKKEMERKIDTSNHLGESNSVRIKKMEEKFESVESNQENFEALYKQLKNSKNDLGFETVCRRLEELESFIKKYRHAISQLESQSKDLSENQCVEQQQVNNKINFFLN